MHVSDMEPTDVPARARRLTVDELALMRAIVLWRRQTLAPATWPQVDYYKRRWSRGFREVSFELPKVDDPADGYAVVSFAPGRYASLTHIEARSLVEGVDVLVAFGYLPPRFSSAYRAGWDTGREDVEHPLFGDEFRAVLPAGQAPRDR